MVSINYFYTNKFFPGEMAQRNANQPLSPHHSRVSSSDQSQHSQSYELIPRDQPFPNLHRDLPSPRASFPFKRVQPGVESSMNNKSHSQSRASGRGDSSHERESKQLIEAIGELRGSNVIGGKMEQEERRIIQPISHEECNSKIQQLEVRVQLLKGRIQSQNEEFQFQRKANDAYKEGFAKIRQIVSAYSATKVEEDGVWDVVERLQQLMRRPMVEGNGYDIIEEQEKKIGELRLQLLKSSQNNINAIFNTEITEAHCMHLQIKKMNGEILTLKQNLLKVSAQNEYNVAQLMQKDKVVKVYHHNRTALETSDEEDIHTELKLTRRRRSKRRNRRDSSSSDKKSKSRILSSTESKVGELVEGYKVLRDQYKRLENTLGQIFQNNTEYRSLFLNLKTEINNTLQTQLQEVKQKLRRPSSSHSELRVAKDIQFKLNHLVNTLNAPQRVNIEQNMGDDEAIDWKSVQMQRRMIDFQSDKTYLHQQVSHLANENQQLKRKLWIFEHQPSRSLPPVNMANSLETFSQNLITQ